MTKQEYMNKLREKLADFDEEIRNEIVSDYEEHFRMGEANGKTEDKICEELGSIDELVDELNKLTGRETKSKGIHIDEEQFKQAAESFSNGMNEAMKNIAGFFGSFAATLSKGTSKFTSNVGEKAGKFSEKAGDFAGEFTEKAGDFAGNVGDKAEEDAKAFKNGFQTAAEKFVNKSEAFAKEVTESYRKSMNKDAAQAAADTPADEDSENRCGAQQEETGRSFSFNFFTDDEKKNTEDGGETPVSSQECSCEDVDSVVVQTDCGDVEIEESDDGRVYFDYQNDGTPNQQLVYRFNFRQEGRTVYAIAKKAPGTTNFFKSMSCPDITVSVKIPAGLKNVSINTMSGDISAEDISVEQMTAKTLSGDIEFENCMAKACEINTMSGDVTLNDCTFVSGSCNTVSGDVEADDCNLQDVFVKTTSGDIEFTDVTAGDLSAEAVSGDIEIELADCEGYLAHVKTTCGDVSLNYNDESIEIIRSGSYVLGDGQVKLNLTSVSGDISVEG